MVFFVRVFFATAQALRSAKTHARKILQNFFDRFMAQALASMSLNKYGYQPWLEATNTE
ncbi:MAG: hypothetical protein RLN89_02300 [Parvibaculum sp.]